MTKHKGFHGPGGKGVLVRQMAFYCRKNPWDVKAQPLARKKETNTVALTPPPEQEGEPR